MHYSRWKRHGDPNATAAWYGAAKRFLRFAIAGEYGPECLSWPFARNTEGYAHITINGRTEYVARLVCEAVNGSPPTQQHHTAHGCGNGGDPVSCVHRAHLRWATPKENAEDTVLHGRSTRGERHARHKLVEAEVREIRRLLAGGMAVAEVARRFPVTTGAIYVIRSGRNWAWLK